MSRAQAGRPTNANDSAPFKHGAESFVFDSLVVLSELCVGVHQVGDLARERRSVLVGGERLFGFAAMADGVVSTFESAHVLVSPCLGMRESTPGAETVFVLL